MNPRTRVQDILQKLRASDTSSFDAETAPKYDFGAFQRNTSAASLRIPSGLTRSFHDSKDYGSMVGGGKSASNRSSSTTSAFNGHSVLVWIISVVALGSIFLVVGQWVDTRLADDSSTESDHSTLLLKTCFQIVLNMSLLLVPFLLLQHYGPSTLLYKYYFFLVFPLWVISLLGQPLLRTRLQRILDDEPRKTNPSSIQDRAPPKPPIQDTTTYVPHPKKTKSASMIQTKQAIPPNLHEGFIRAQTRPLPVIGRHAEHTPPEVETPVHFQSSLLPSPSNEPFEFHGHGSEAKPRHTSLDDLFG